MVLSFYNNGNDTVIAENPEDAAKVWEETTGDNWAEFVLREALDAEWDLKNYPILTLCLEDEDDVREMAPDGAEIWREKAGDYYRVKATGQQWIDKLGRCFFSSEDW